MSGLALITGPQLEPVSTAEMKDHLRLPSAPMDEARLSDMLRAACRHIEGETARALIEQTWEYSLDGVPCQRYIELPKPPLMEVVSLTTYSTADVPTVILPTSTNTFADYLVDTSTLFGRFALKYGRSWPSNLREFRAVVIKFKCGWTIDTLPATLRDAVILLAAHWYDAGRAPVNIGNTVSEVPFTLRTLLESGNNTVRQRFG